jgi:hypothetical protein
VNLRKDHYLNPKNLVLRLLGRERARAASRRQGRANDPDPGAGVTLGACARAASGRQGGLTTQTLARA